MHTLFGNLESGNVHKVAMLLVRFGIPYRRVDVQQVKGEPRDPRFLALNPIGKVPALLMPDGDLLTESGAILYLLAHSTPLWPDDVRSQSEVLRWMFFEQYSHEPSLAVMRYLRRHAPSSTEHEARAATLEPKARMALDAMEAQLRSHPWIAGAMPTIADYALYPYTRWANESGLEIAAWRAVDAWLGRMERLPAFLALRQCKAVETSTFDAYFGSGLQPWT